MNKNSKDYQLEVTFNVVDKAIYDLFDSIKVSEKDYKEMVDAVSDKIDIMAQEQKENYSKTLLRLNRVKSQKIEFIKHNLGARRTKDEEVIYASELRKYDDQINFVQKELSAINEEERNKLVEFQLLLDVLRKSASLYKKSSYVRKYAIIELFISNIVLDKQKRLTLEVKPDLQHFFSLSSGDGGARSHV